MYSLTFKFRGLVDPKNSIKMSHEN